MSLRKKPTAMPLSPTLTPTSPDRPTDAHHVHSHAHTLSHTHSHRAELQNMCKHANTHRSHKGQMHPQH